MVTLPELAFRAVDDLGVDGSFHRFEHGLAGAFGGEVDGAGAVELEMDAGLARGDERQHHHLHIAARHEMRGQVVDGEGSALPGFHRGDAVVHDERHWHLFAGAGRSIPRFSTLAPEVHARTQMLMKLAMMISTTSATMAAMITCNKQEVARGKLRQNEIHSF